MGWFDRLILTLAGDTVLAGARLDREAIGKAEAGDLTAAVKAVETLKGEPALAMADWLADAKALLSARSALAAMADKA